MTAHSPTDEPLSGGHMGPVARRGDAVVRPAGEWSPAVHRLLRHLRASGFGAAPEPLTLELTQGVEQLTFLPGDVPAYPLPAWVWSERALDSAARLLREFHAASADADRAGPWRSPVHEPVEVVCHNDFAPYNLVFDDATAVGVIDFDFASPGPRLWDLAYLAYRVVPLSRDRSDGFDDGERRRRFHRLIEVYCGDEAPWFGLAELLHTVADRLDELAAFSDAKAVELRQPELADHAEIYRTDAANIRGWLHEHEPTALRKAP